MERRLKRYFNYLGLQIEIEKSSTELDGVRWRFSIRRKSTPGAPYKTKTKGDFLIVTAFKYRNVDTALTMAKAEVDKMEKDALLTP